LSSEHADKLEAQLRAEVAELLALAEAADAVGVPDGMSVPEELARCEERLARIAEAKTKIEARAKERFARERFAEAPPPPEKATPLETMRYHLATPEGKLLYRLRKQIPEPVFGIVKSAIGFRQFLLRGLDKVKGEWSLVTMAFNVKRMFALGGA
jgi:hypothetical protein